MTKPSIDIDALSIDQMLDLKDALETRLADIAKAETGPLEKRLARLQAYLPRPDQVEKAPAKKAPKPRAPKTGKAAKRGKVAPRFKDPATGQTWSGRGRTPVWLRDYEAAGRKRDEFSI